MPRTETPSRDTYPRLLASVLTLIEHGKSSAARVVNATLTTTYWLIGRRIVEHEQKGKRRADYGGELVAKLSHDLTRRLGRGFSQRNVEQMRDFYLTWQIPQTASAELTDERKSGIPQTVSAEFAATVFPLPWSHYVRLLSVRDESARRYYESEAIRGGWSVRQLDREISSLAFQRIKGRQ